MPQRIGDASPSWHDTAFYIALILAVFTILFGTRHLDVAERHEGMVAAIAFESLVKLVAFLAVGVFVTFGMYDGPATSSRRAAAHPKLAPLLTPLGGAAGQLRELGLAHLPVHARDHVPAAAVPDRGRRERRTRTT